ncbi:MAG: terpene cyclase/mutase family protein [Chloroflexi bacterium]|nr:terpene cyclase/mutase family protein [Chloroflexota bacterium]
MSFLTTRNPRDTLQRMTDGAEFLVRAQNSDGGWGYRVGGMSYVQPTAAALLAFADPNRAACGRARDFLLSLQHADGGWGIAAIDDESGWMTAWAMLGLTAFPDAQVAVANGASWLLASEGTRVTDPAARAQAQQMFRIDSTLRGWPWQTYDAAWVHPTALAILALVSAGRSDHARIRQGVEYLLDRAVQSGGWNVGNPQMIDKPVPATIQDTAIALLALRAVGRTRDEPRIAQGLEFLQRAVAAVKTPAELAWGAYALGEWNAQTGDARARLNELQRVDGSWQMNPFITATAILANRI